MPAPYLLRRSSGSFGARAANSRMRSRGFRSRVLGSARRSYRRTRSRRYGRGKTSFARAVKSVMFSLAEKKYKSINLNAQTTLAPWNHDSLSRADLWNSPGGASFNTLFPIQGNSDGERNGDEIYVHGIRVRGVIDVVYDRPDTEIKMWFVPHNSTQGDPAVKTDFMHGTINNVWIDGVQTDRWPGCRYLGKLRVRPKDSYAYKAEIAEVLEEMEGRERRLAFNKYITLKRKVKFTNDGSNIPSNLQERGSIIFATYCTVGTGTGDNCVIARNIAATIYYKDP